MVREDRRSVRASRAGGSRSGRRDRERPGQSDPRGVSDEMPWHLSRSVFRREQDDEPDGAGQNERSGRGRAEAGKTNKVVPAGQFGRAALGKTGDRLAQRGIEAIEFGVGAIVFESGIFQDTERVAQFAADISAVPFPVVDALDLVGVIVKGVDGGGAEFDEALGFGLLALDGEETAGELIGDFGAAPAVFLLLAAEVLEFILLAFEFLLLTMEGEQMFASEFEFGIDFFAMWRQFDHGKRRP